MTIFCRLEDAEKAVSQESSSGSRLLQGMPQAVSCLARVLGQIWHCAARALSGEYTVRGCLTKFPVVMICIGIIFGCKT